MNWFLKQERKSLLFRGKGRPSLNGLFRQKFVKSVTYRFVKIVTLRNI